MSDFNFDLQQDLHEAQKMAQKMADYVRQNEHYLNMGANMPAMTLGGFLLRRRRLEVFQEQLQQQQRTLLDEIDEIHTTVMTEWNYHYTKKLVEEALSRLRVMVNYLEDCEYNPGDCDVNYKPEAYRRTIIQELFSKLQQLNADDTYRVQEEIAKVDQRLRSLLEPGDFLVDEKLKPAYPENEFWWLYGQPATTHDKTVQPDSEQVH